MMVMKNTKCASESSEKEADGSGSGCFVGSAQNTPEKKASCKNACLFSFVLVVTFYFDV